jgi:hypothetical protein
MLVKGKSERWNQDFNKRHDLRWAKTYDEIVGEVLIFFLKLNIDLPYDQQYHSSGHTPRDTTQVITKAPAHSVNSAVYCSTIHSSQAMETAKMPHYRWMD